MMSNIGLEKDIEKGMGTKEREREQERKSAKLNTILHLSSFRKGTENQIEILAKNYRFAIIER